MRVLIGGASGLMGRLLRERLSEAGHDVQVLVRRPTRAANEHQWTPGVPPTSAVADADAVINLSGAPVATRRWTNSYRREIVSSRVSATSALAQAIAESAHKPVLLSMSGIGYYGNRPGEQLTEASSSGDSFLAGVCRQWEAATEPAWKSGARVVQVRMGTVLDGRDGALPIMLIPYRLGIGGPLGGGQQHFPWVSALDAARAFEFMLNYEVHGAVNLCSPQLTTNKQFNDALGRALHRPAFIPVPGFALKLLLGGFSAELLADQAAIPAKLSEFGFTWSQPDMPSALKSALSR